MNARIAELKNNLSRLLREMAASGEPITVFDRDTPVAKIIPLRGKKPKATAWEREREMLRKSAAKHGVKLNLTAEKPAATTPAPRVARDGRRDVATVAALRAEKNY